MFAYKDFHFRVIFQSLWCHFRVIFEESWDDFGVILAPPRNYFGVTLGSSQNCFQIRWGTFIHFSWASPPSSHAIDQTFFQILSFKVGIAWRIVICELLKYYVMLYFLCYVIFIILCRLFFCSFLLSWLLFFYSLLTRLRADASAPGPIPFIGSVILSCLCRFVGYLVVWILKICFYAMVKHLVDNNEILATIYWKVELWRDLGRSWGSLGRYFEQCWLEVGLLLLRCELCCDILGSKMAAKIAI